MLSWTIFIDTPGLTAIGQSWRWRPPQGGGGKKDHLFLTTLQENLNA